MPYIYKITNIINGKIYVGKTTQTIEKRFEDHIKASKSLINDTYFYRSIRKYGAENFKVEKLCRCSEEDINKLEDFYIVELNAKDSNVGYNEKDGGDGGKLYGESKIKHREGIKKAIAEGNENLVKTLFKKGHKFSDEVKLKMRMAKLGKTSNFKGKTHTEEAKIKCGIVNIGISRSPNTEFKKGSNKHE